MSRDVLTVGLTMRIPLLFRGEYSQWSERFMNYLEEQTVGEAMINSIKNGDHLLPTVSQVDSNKTAKDLWDALERHMLGFEYGGQDRKAVVLYEYETFKATEGELLLDTYIRYLQVINDLKKYGYSKDNYELIFKFLNNLQLQWKQYATMMRQNKNLLDINIDALYNILKQNQGDVNDAMKSKKKAVVITFDPLALVAEQTKITTLLAKAFNRKKFDSKPTNNNLRTSSATSSANKKQESVKYDDKKEEKKVVEKKRDMSKVKCYNCKKEGHFAKDCKKSKVKDYEYYKTKMLLTKKDKDEQVLLVEDHAWMESSSDSDQEINVNMVFMAQIEKVLLDYEKSSSSSDDTIAKIVHIFLWIIDSGCSKHMTSNRALLTNFVEKFLGTVRFGNNDFTVIAGYGDVVIGSMTIKKVYYVEGLGHNLFSVGQFCDNGLEVAFRKSTCFVQNENGVDLLTGDRSLNLYTIALNEIASNSSNCLLAKASSSQSWLWLQRLSHLNFATINNLVKNILVRDEASEVIISFIKKTQVNLQLQVQRIRNDNSTEFKNKTLAKFFDEVGISQQFSAVRVPQQNGVVERRYRTLVEAARTMLTFANLPLFLWAETIATASFTQNHSIIHKHFNKTPYELINKRKPNIKFFHVFRCRCYLLNDYDDVGKLKAKGDIGVFVGYSKASAAFRVYNKPTRKIHESVNVNFDEISEMASK
nr:integrase, catalytic region, zinc finger, CCHC-type, peptidase aspartic, catalytic [Tanacetum cinerariifolium]